MQYINGLEAYQSRRPAAVTLGKFDGLHRGHEKLIGIVQKIGREENVDSVVCVFDMISAPERISGSGSAAGQYLMTGEERKSRLEGRVDWLVECPFTPEFSRMKAEEFIDRVLAGVFRAAFVVVGTDFRFGYQKEGDVRMLEDYAGTYGYRLVVVKKERYGQGEIASTLIREAVRRGDMPLAKTLLGYPYTVTGTVEHGRRLGRTLGFPTINVSPAREKALPPNGVYMSRVFLDGVWYHAVANVGVKPTVERDGRILVESFLFGYHGDAYGKNVKIELLEFRRPERKFDGVSGLKECIDRDLAAGREFFSDK